MNHENEHIHYRCRFNLSRPEGEDVLGYVQRTIFTWVCKKERGRRNTGELNIADALDEKRETGHRPGRVATGLERFRSGHFDEVSGREGRNRGPCLRVRAASGDRRSRVWAMDYNEPGSEADHDLDGWRRWHTRIGLVMRGDGSCDVVMNVGWYVLPEYVGAPLGDPPSNVPNIVRTLLDDNAPRLRVGSTPLNLEVTDLDDQGTDVFLESLFDEGRELPLVLVTGGNDGALPVHSIEDVMDAVRGLANVYTLSPQTTCAWLKFRGYFKRGTPSWNYRCNQRVVRVYFPGVDLRDRFGSSRHPFYTSRLISELSDWHASDEGFIDDLARRLSFAVSRFPGDVLDLEDVALLESRERSFRRAKRLYEVTGRLRAEASRNAELQEEKERIQREREAEASRNAELQEENERIQREKDDIEELVDLADETIGAYEELQDKVKELEGEIQDKDWQLREAHRRAGCAKEEVRAADALRDAFLGMDWIPKELTELLDLAASAWPTRLAVCPEARTSAMECTTFDLQEAWRILRGIALDLHPLVFEEEARDLEGSFKSRTGFALAMTESSTTQSQSNIMKSRSITFEGNAYDITPHIKGRGRGGGRGKGEFRVHFAIDREGERIVIGHFGDHMTTAGTRK